MAKAQIEWDKYFQESMAQPLETTRDPPNGLSVINEMLGWTGYAGLQHHPAHYD